MKNKILVTLFISYILIFSLLGIIFKDNEISVTERRKLSKFPELTLNSEYIVKLDKYFLDHFPFRDNFRNIKAQFNYKILKKLDNNGIYLKDNYIFKSEYPTNEKSIQNFINLVSTTNDSLNENNNRYIMIIPDKNYYLNDDKFLNIDYDYLYKEIDKLNINAIDIRNIMNIDDYYETDTHWKQEKLDKVVNKIVTSMNLNYIEEQYDINTYNKFYGVYYGQSAINRKPENLKYLTNKTIDNLEVKYLENDKLSDIYNLDKLTSTDSYQLYLDGASSFIEIINKNSKTEKELVIFRDSFASSITPLLTSYYSKITLIDNRYINSYNYNKLIEFTNQDVLFMYSTLLVNNSYSLKG